MTEMATKADTDPAAEAVDNAAAEDPDDPVAGFRHELDLLLINSKPMITMLTMLADDYKEAYAEEIADCIEERLFSVQSPEVKLPTLYLIDSICKNLGESSAYVALFQRKIGHIFTHTFERAKDDKTRLLLHKLRQTWNEVFHPEVLHSLDVAVHRIDPGWPVLPAQAPKSNRSVLPPSSSNPSTSSGSSTSQPSPLTKWPIPKITRQVSTVATTASQAAAALTTAATTLPPPSREIIEQQLQAVRNQQIELQLYNDLLLRTMNASASTSASTSSSGNSPPEVVSSSTNNSSNNHKQQSNKPQVNRKLNEASNASKRGRNISPSESNGKRRRRASSPDSHQSSSNSKSGGQQQQRSPIANKSSESSPRSRQTQQHSNNRRNSRDDRKEGSSKETQPRRPLPTSPRIRKNSSNTPSEPLPPPPAPDSVIPLGSSHHVSVSKRVIKPGNGSRRNAEGSAIVAAIRSHRRVSPPPPQNRNPHSSKHSRSRSPPPRNSSSERMTFNIPQKQPTPPLLQTKAEEEEGGFGAMDVDYRQAFVPSVKMEGHDHLASSSPVDSFLPPAFQQQPPPSAQPPLVISPPISASPASISPVQPQTASLAPQLVPDQFQPTPLPLAPLQPSLPVSTFVHLTTSAPPFPQTIVQPLLQEPHGSVVLFINSELARLYYLDQVTAVVVKAHPDTSFDTLVSWAPAALEPRQVFFAGPTTYVYVDEGTSAAQTLCLEFSRIPAPMAFYVAGAPHQQQTIQLGLPARELVLNGAAYTIAFGGEPISVYLGEAAGYHTFRLSDSRPHLQFSEEVRYDLWTRLVDEARIKAGLPPMAVAFPAMNNTVSQTPVIKVEEPPPVTSQPSQPLESPDLNSLLSKLTAAGLISNPPASVLAAPSATPVEPVKPTPQPLPPASVIPAASQLPQPPPPSNQFPPLPHLPPVPTSHHPNGRRKTKRERRLERQRYRQAVHQQAQAALKQQQLAKMQQQARLAKPQPPKSYLPLEVTSLKAVHAFPVEQLYSGTPCTNCSLRFGEEALKAEEGKKSRYARHLDWHFRQNRRLKAKPVSTGGDSSAISSKSRRGQNSKTSASSSGPTISTAAAAQRRAWYYPLDLWILFKEVNDDLEEEAAAAAAFFDANASASAASGASTASSSALLATLASFDWGRFRARIEPYEAFMEVVNRSHAVGAVADAEAVAAKCAKCTVVAESAFTEITCALCKEVLEQKWGEEEEEWRVENAVRYRETAEDLENSTEESTPPVEVKIYHPLCLKDYLVAKERAKQEQEAQQQMEEEEEAADDEEDEEDEDLDELELESSLTETTTEDQPMAVNTTTADNTPDEVKEEEVKAADRVLIPGLDISLRSSTDNDEDAEQVMVKEEEEEEKMDGESTSVEATSDNQQQLTKQTVVKEEEEEVYREIEVKVFEFEIPIAASSSNASVSQSIASTELLQQTSEEEIAAPVLSPEPAEKPSSLDQEESSVVISDQRQPEANLPPSLQQGLESDENQNSIAGKSTQPSQPPPPPKRGGLVINLKKTSFAATASLSSPITSTIPPSSTHDDLGNVQPSSPSPITKDTSSSDSLISDDQPKPIKTDDEVKEEEKPFLDNIGHSSSNDQSSDDNKVDEGHVIKGDEDKDKDVDGSSSNDPHTTEDIVSGTQGTGDTGPVPPSIILSSNEQQEGGLVGSLSLPTEHPQPLTLSTSLKSTAPSEVKDEAPSEEVLEKETSNDPNYYSRGVEMSSLCSIM